MIWQFTFILVSSKNFKSLISLHFWHIFPSSSFKRDIELIILILSTDQLDKVYSIEKKVKSNFEDLILYLVIKVGLKI